LVSDPSFSDNAEKTSREAEAGEKIMKLLERYARPLSVPFISFSLGASTPETRHFIRYLGRQGKIRINVNGYVEPADLR